jgi:hypothetical protein
VSEYVLQYGKVMDDTFRCAIVMSRALPRARDHQRFLPQEMLQNYATLRKRHSAPGATRPELRPAWPPCAGDRCCETVLA